MIRTVTADGAAEYELIEKLGKRSLEIGLEVSEAVGRIIKDVISSGDEAVLRYTKQFDGVELTELELPREEFEKGAESCPEELKRVIKRAAENITAYHKKQKREGFSLEPSEGIKLGQRIQPLERAGLYVPGGTASYPSSVLMNAIPAKVAGVNELIMATPPGKDGRVPPAILAAARIAGVDRVFLMGGAQAIAALSYGTKSVPKVDKIVGPGNIYVATAKRHVFGSVDIDMIAGPSEILIIADETANPDFAAADMLSQAEHDKLSSATLLCLSAGFAKRVEKSIERQRGYLKRREYIDESLSSFGAIIICRDIDEALKLSNLIAPEHLELMCENPLELLEKVKNAGSVFLGSYSPEPLGDYMAGPNHVLPTGGTARFFSPLGVDSFIKKSSFIMYDKPSLKALADDIILFAQSESLYAHANAVRTRFEDREKL